MGINLLGGVGREGGWGLGRVKTYWKTHIVGFFQGICVLQQYKILPV